MTVEKFEQHIENHACSGFWGLPLVTENHSTNVDAFNSLAGIFVSDCSYFFNIYSFTRRERIAMFFDTVHLVKNI